MDGPSEDHRGQKREREDDESEQADVKRPALVVWAASESDDHETDVPTCSTATAISSTVTTTTSTTSPSHSDAVVLHSEQSNPPALVEDPEPDVELEGCEDAVASTIAAFAEEHRHAVDGGVRLNIHDCSLTLMVEGTSAQSIPLGSLSTLRGGVRADTGVLRGCFAFECRVVSMAGKGNPLVRVGWSRAKTSLMLDKQGGTAFGSDLLSWHGGVCKVARAQDRLGPGDVLTAVVHTRRPKTLFSWLRNGVPLPHTWEMDDVDEPLFPHVMLRSASVQLNFDASKAAFPLPEGCSFLDAATCGGDSPEAERSPAVSDVNGGTALFVVGLPASGRFTHATNLVQAAPDKHYQIIGTPLLESLVGLTPHGLTVRKANFTLGLLYRVAATRPENYIIIDNSFVYSNARKAAACIFSHFSKSAVILTPSLTDLSTRMESKKHKLPAALVFTYKKHFSCPLESEAAELFQSNVEWIPDQQTALSNAESYRAQARAQAPAPVAANRPRTLPFPNGVLPRPSALMPAALLPAMRAAQSQQLLRINMALAGRGQAGKARPPPGGGPPPLAGMCAPMFGVPNALAAAAPLLQSARMTQVLRSCGANAPQLQRLFQPPLLTQQSPLKNSPVLLRPPVAGASPLSGRPSALNVPQVLLQQGASLPRSPFLFARKGF
eukprot:gnl/Spiro4/230_TR134_c0_g1_i1.p1 gnl/Spiro4/230_TR134_c0_g1~~gnl/Spiro4/230_TR134_c0_g1_i1.p1  ORF type:complete len:665 (+),score=94.75 gnl/Spiro4/230_TR134_c0_g1_i1:35-2029(+)